MQCRDPDCGGVMKYTDDTPDGGEVLRCTGCGDVAIQHPDGYLE